MSSKSYKGNKGRDLFELLKYLLDGRSLKFQVMVMIFIAQFFAT